MHSRLPFAVTPLALVACALWHALPAAAQAPDVEAPLQLKPSLGLREGLSDPERRQLATHLSGDRISGRPDLETVLEGNAVLRKGDMVIRADRLEYYQPDDLARARGNVRVNRAGNVYEGPLLELKVDAFEGFFSEPRYRFLRNDAYGQADRIDFLDDKRAVVRNATYSTCQRRPGPDWMPDWILRAASLKLDSEEEVGQAEGAVLSFLGVPLLPIPSLSFPLSDKRKSGFLPPTIGIDSLSGIEVTQPYYWNIAPNRDATLYPTLMTKRGVDLGGEFRYLEANYNGKVRANWMPDDSLRDRSRWGYAWTQDALLSRNFAGGGPLNLALNLNRVSDDNYWRDFSGTSASLTQRLLANDALLSWSYGDLGFSARRLHWQTLQDTSSPIVPPYDRLPQLVGRYGRNNLAGGLDLSVEADYTRFQSVRELTLQPNGQRFVAQAQISRPWQAPGWFVTPKLQLHSTHYQFDTPLTNGATSAARALPTFSLDSGLVFERDAAYFGRSFRQTLEPRAFYVYTPYRDQSLLPNYDSGSNDFNFATIYTENAFGGQDRIADNNLLTLGATTRLLDPSSGAEAARFGVAQRLRFKDQRVTLPGGSVVDERISDVLMGATVNWDPKWSVDATVQYNQKSSRSVRSTMGVRYNPGETRVVSAAYRLQRGLSEQLDLGWQWPVGRAGSGPGPGRWYSVGRLNFSMKDSRLVDSVVGFEYDADCWIGRVVLERLQSSTTSSNKRILFQLEFNGFTRLGSNALQSLKQNIPRYQYLREQTTAPSRFTQYE